jgi:hypothetical protein
MARFDLSDYEPVEDRLRRFWAEHPEGRVLTDLIAYSDSQFIVRAEIYFNREDDRPVASGYAEETVTQRGVNQTSAAENCETSAIGRALANCGYAPKGKRPSQEEMRKVQRRGSSSGRVIEATIADKERIAGLIASVSVMGLDALREIWRDNEAFLDLQIEGQTMTLKDAIVARKDEITGEAAA